MCVSKSPHYLYPVKVSSKTSNFLKFRPRILSMCFSIKMRIGVTQKVLFVFPDDSSPHNNKIDVVQNFSQKLLFTYMFLLRTFFYGTHCICHYNLIKLRRNLFHGNLNSYKRKKQIFYYLKIFQIHHEFNIFFSLRDLKHSLVLLLRNKIISNIFL